MVVLAAESQPLSASAIVGEKSQNAGRWRAVGGTRLRVYEAPPSSVSPSTLDGGTFVPQRQKLNKSQRLNEKMETKLVGESIDANEAWQLKL